MVKYAVSVDRITAEYNAEGEIMRYVKTGMKLMHLQKH